MFSDIVGPNTYEAGHAQALADKRAGRTIPCLHGWGSLSEWAKGYTAAWGR